MTNYTQSGQPHGLKSLAQELPKYGRYGDSIVAHINPQEAAMLKAMGGSGTINPVTGLPEYFFKGISRPFVDAWKGVTNLPGIKQVSDAVTPLAQQVAPWMPYIAPFIPGVGPLMAAAIGGVSAGFGKGQGGFNFKRGLMGGMTAYGLSNLYAGLQSAALSGQTPLPSDVAAASQANSGNVANLATLEAGPQAGMFEAAAQPSMGSNIMSGNLSDAATQFGDKATMMGKDFATQMGNAGEGIKNLVGAGGDVSMSEAAKAVGTKFGTGSAAAMFTGASGLAALDEEQKYLDQQKAAGNIADTEYQENIARIQEARKRAEEAVLANPYKFARGGSIDDELGGDYSAMGMDQGNLQKGLFGMGYAEGGTPRFLSGGGDGMSDSIPATINGRQPARLADGEFVVPADVVSGIGNGSSKAGAKRLYGMMDRVRKDRTGTTKQAKAINPAKLMAA
jgi:hypothetical protein